MTRTKSRLVFDHIPKTAGTSVTAALSLAFGEEEQPSVTIGPHRHAIAAAGTKRMVAGHLWFAPGEPLAEDWFYCTVLRDPLDRFVSQYWFHREVGFRAAKENPADVSLLDPSVRAAMKYSLHDFLGSS